MLKSVRDLQNYGEENEIAKLREVRFFFNISG